MCEVAFGYNLWEILLKVGFSLILIKLFVKFCLIPLKEEK
jgi:hypothetical protein